MGAQLLLISTCKAHTHTLFLTGNILLKLRGVKAMGHTLFLTGNILIKPRQYTLRLCSQAIGSSENSNPMPEVAHRLYGSVVCRTKVHAPRCGGQPIAALRGVCSEQPDNRPHSMGSRTDSPFDKEASRNHLKTKQQTEQASKRNMF